MARPRNKVKSSRVYLTLPEPDCELLAAYARQAGKQTATIGGEILVKVLRGAAEDQEAVDPQQIDNVIRALRGEPTYPAQNEPRWGWPIDLLLGDSKWWRQWYPELCRLLGRQMQIPRPSRPGAGDQVPVLNAEGYADVMEFLFPALAGPKGTVTWRDLQYPTIAESRAPDEGTRPLAPVWGAVIRHVAVALSALEDAKAASALVLVESQLRHDWLAVLLSLVGEASPPASPRLPQKRLV